MSRKSGLGKGLSALIPTEYAETEVAPAADPDSDASAPAAPATGGPIHVPVSAIEPNHRQPRQRFDEEALAGLTASIRELGVLQPVLVRRISADEYELIAGERRWRAAKRAGLPTVPVVVRDADTDESLLEQALVENLHRADLNALEEAAAYQQLIEDFGLTQDQVATRVGKSRTAITNTLRLFQLPPTVQALVADGRLSAGHARAILGTPDRSRQETLAKQAIDEGWSVRETERIVRGDDEDDDVVDLAEESSEPAVSAPRTPAPRPVPEPGILELERLLSDHLDTRVQVSAGKGPGKVVIEFADLADLERIYRAMVH